MVALFCLFIASAIGGTQFFAVEDSGVPVALFASVPFSEGACTLLFTTKFMFILQNFSIVTSKTPLVDFLTNPLGQQVQAVALFKDARSNGGAFVIALADSFGGLSFASIKGCEPSITILPTWFTSFSKANWTGAFRLDGANDAFAFVSSTTESVVVSWTQGVNGIQLGVVSSSSVSVSSPRCVVFENSMHVMDSAAVEIYSLRPTNLASGNRTVSEFGLSGDNLPASLRCTFCNSFSNASVVGPGFFGGFYDLEKKRAIALAVFESTQQSMYFAQHGQQMISSYPFVVGKLTASVMFLSPALGQFK
jgi:hypothetical protein